jgi:hypothetical protein
MTGGLIPDVGSFPVCEERKRGSEEERSKKGKRVISDLLLFRSA